jgi:hypothetical protein
LFIRLQFLNGYIFVPHKTREYVFLDDCVLFVRLRTKMVSDQSVTLGLRASFAEQLLQKADKNSFTSANTVTRY